MREHRLDGWSSASLGYSVVLPRFLYIPAKPDSQTQPSRRAAHITPAPESFRSDSADQELRRSLVPSVSPRPSNEPLRRFRDVTNRAVKILSHGFLAHRDRMRSKSPV